MTTLAPTRAARRSGAAVLWALAFALGAAVLVALRLRAAHPAPLYPDGYQYLAMARGIAESGRPLLQLGPAGDLLVPSVDAAAKPLYPALVALLHLAGVPLSAGARVVAAFAGAALAPLVGALVHRVAGRSLTAALAAAALVVASPTLGFWVGFAGPDALAVALGLGAAVAFAWRAERLGGVLAALACASRPELVLLAGAALVAGLAHPPAQQAARRAVPAALGVAALLAVVLRPPLGVPGVGVIAAGLVGVLLAGLGAAFALRVRARRGALAGVSCLVALPAVLVTIRAGGSGALGSLVTREWLLLALAGAGLVVALTRPGHALAATLGASTAGWLGAAYLLKNPGSERYLALLVPVAAIWLGLGVASLPGRASRLAAVVVLAAATVTGLARPAPTVGRDMFPEIAAGLSGLPAGVIVTAAPDAYGVLVPGRSIRSMAPGRRGLVVDDATARAYEPDLAARGRLVAVIPTRIGFLRPDGRLDRDPVRVIDGVVVTR